ncbi:N5-carboxyaminoimidazole ribonucleotide synthase [Thermaurantimonas aggregans]|uniref:N5-carboxyaminoimidazole ribonucleotide synthase n=1 Tax=Thermaurantimonas aggregans TaxID=2173829 RepID=A0A401XM75_9FLAO|nr:5-(carboxyamino)imidazole ribonucleotide synthase [Thermaurantimonas aggregans]MCX8147972.1 5-(carboxyamino)imidazole ribonucleotide synthase [Thermaurantimonas aggregans]GCD78103.1 N5-carboxyaminoimidazole ribonucleotide synthase [Thermaurantimonas aggregans]
MNSYFSTQNKIGILGGGQLGKMLALAAAPWDLYLKVLDPAPDAPCQHYVKEFVFGDFRDYQTVLNFGLDCEVITIEIEDVNTQALYELEKLRKKVYPQPGIIEIFQDKQRQKQFYIKHELPTPYYREFSSKKELLNFLKQSNAQYPLIWKAARGGFDGRGVRKLHSLDEAQQMPDTPCIVEELIDIRAETAVIVHRSASGQIACQPVVQMEFHPMAHFVELVYVPTRLSIDIERQCFELAMKLAGELNLVGTLAVEFFVTTDQRVLINEAAPRVHNSGHLTIEATASSQFEQHLRAITGLPLGDTSLLHPAVMFNLTGHPDHQGPVHYAGAEHVLSMPQTYFHLYGKSTTKPYRKMGHITAIGSDINELLSQIQKIKNTIHVIST